MTLSAPRNGRQKNGQFFWSVTGKQASSWGNGTSYRCTVPPNYRGGLLISEKRGKEVFYTTSETGRTLCDDYRAVRKQCLLEGIGRMDLTGEDMRQIASHLRALSGQYDQASRAAASL